jgi:hypothetical protein
VLTSLIKVPAFKGPFLDGLVPWYPQLRDGRNSTLPVFRKLFAVAYGKNAIPRRVALTFFEATQQLMAYFCRPHGDQTYWDKFDPSARLPAAVLVSYIHNRHDTNKLYHFTGASSGEVCSAVGHPDDSSAMVSALRLIAAFADLG